MKLLTLTLLLAAVALGQDTKASKTSPQLTNQDVVEMRSAGLGTEVIVAKIQSASCNFKMEPSDLADLKTAGLDDAVILAMLKTQAPTTTASSPQTARVEAAATLHFYRDRQPAAALRIMPIYVDEEKVAGLANGRQFTIPIQSGKHTFRCRTKEDSITVEIEPGREYYFRAEFIQGAFLKSRWRIVQLANQQGELDIQRLKLLDPADITPPKASGQLR